MVPGTSVLLAVEPVPVPVSANCEKQAFINREVQSSTPIASIQYSNGEEYRTQAAQVLVHGPSSTA